MIRVRRLAHASYETPDVERMVAYYIEILGLSLVEKETDTAYLAATLDHHAIVLRKGSEPKCVRLAFQISPETELGYFEPRPWHRDRPQKPKVWPKDPSSANLWGIMAPEEMMR